MGKYRLLVTDVDGTLLPPDRRVLPSVREAVQAARARGIRVCLATGRMWRSVRPYVEAVGADSPVVLFNGAVVYDFSSGRLLEHHTLAPEAARTALQAVAEFPDVRPHVFTLEGVYVDRCDPRSRAYLERDGIGAEEVGDLVAALPHDAVKVLVVGDPDRLVEVDRVLAQGELALRRVFSERDFLELLPAGVSKATGLRAICRALDVALEEVVAVGDNPNDVEMVEEAGLGVAVANAHPVLKEAARYVTRAPGGEAIAEVVERFLLRVVEEA